MFLRFFETHNTVTSGQITNGDHNTQSKFYQNANNKCWNFNIQCPIQTERRKDTHMYSFTCTCCMIAT